MRNDFKVLALIFENMNIIVYPNEGEGFDFTTDGEIISSTDSGQTKTVKYANGKIIQYVKDKISFRLHPNKVREIHNYGAKTYTLQYPDGSYESYEYDGTSLGKADASGKSDIKPSKAISDQNLAMAKMMKRHGVDYNDPEGWSKLGKISTKIAIKKAENYMRDYHGLFLHSLDEGEVANFINLKGDEEVCCSTVRSNTVFHHLRDYNIVLLGFGNITRLYDVDAYSEAGNDKTREAIRDLNPIQSIESPELHKIDFDAIKKYSKDNADKTGGFDESKYYDEGFLRASTADVLVACLPQKLKNAAETIKSLKTAYPYITFIYTNKFNKLINGTEDLLRYMYRLKEDKEGKELMSQPFHKYEESIEYIYEQMCSLARNTLV